MHILRSFISRLVQPHSKNSDVARRQIMLSVLIFAFFFLGVIALVNNIIRISTGIADGKAGIAIPLIIPAVFLLLLSFLYHLMRKEHVYTSASILLALLFIYSTVELYAYGADLPSALLTYLVIIALSGSLLGARVALIVSLVVSFAVTFIGALQINAQVVPDLYWKHMRMGGDELVMYTALFVFVGVLSWLFNGEVQKLLFQMRHSEEMLLAERDQLAIRVEERAQQLRAEEIKNVAHLYRFVEFGRLASGIFHDLINPLHALLLNMDRLRTEVDRSTHTEEASKYLDAAIRMTHKIEDFVVVARGQMTSRNNYSRFSITKEIHGVIEMLAHKAQQAQVTISFLDPDEITTFGDPIKTSQVALNIISNAIDAKGTLVTVSLTERDGIIVFSVHDNGMGIEPDNIARVFEPFYTTKLDTGGIGIGLTVVRRIVEDDFNGTIAIDSEVGVGTTFTVTADRRKIAYVQNNP